MNSLNGVLLLNKPKNLSSNQALQKVKQIYQVNKAGYAGTLDPLATGLLVIALEEATKYIQYAADSDKIYQAEIKFGLSTTTKDSEGEIIAKTDNIFNLKQLDDACNKFIGETMQTPPIYSALKKDGIPLYKYARSGIDIAINPRKIYIHYLKILNFNFPFATLEIKCSKGTYIRSLVEDIAKELNNFAYLYNLIRITTNNFHIKNSVTLEKLTNTNMIELNNYIYPIELLLSDLKKITLNDEEILQLQQGKIVKHQENYGTIKKLSLFNKKGNFIGIIENNNIKNYYKAIRMMKLQ